MKVNQLLFVGIISCTLASCEANLTSTDIYKNDPEEVQAIKTVLNHQASDWSEGNLERFMDGYWKSDSLMFVGANGITYGWQATLDNYKTRYPDPGHTGMLDFEILYIQKWVLAIII